MKTPISEKIIELRHELHRHAELSMQEHGNEGDAGGPDCENLEPEFRKGGD